MRLTTLIDRFSSFSTNDSEKRKKNTYHYLNKVNVKSIVLEQKQNDKFR